jgi:hypothetical protein
MLILTTNIYEKSFREFLNNDNHCFFSIESKYISSKIITVNNIDNESLRDFNVLRKKTEEKYKDITFIFPYEYKDLCNSLFKVNLSEDDVSYLYSIHNYTSLYLAIESGTDFILTIGADCILSSNYIEPYIIESIQEIKKIDKLLSTTLPWDKDFQEIGNHEESLYPVEYRSNLFYTSMIMSDQVFLVSANKILGVVDFNINEILHPYPVYGIGGFEQRMCNFMIKHKYYRGIHKGDVYYSHNSY